MNVRAWFPRTVAGWVIAVVLWFLLAVLLYKFFGSTAERRSTDSLTSTDVLAILAVVPALYITTRLERLNARIDARNEAHDREVDAIVRRGVAAFPKWASVNGEVDTIVATMPHEQAVTAKAIVVNLTMTLPEEWEALRATVAAREGIDLYGPRRSLEAAMVEHHTEMFNIVGILRIVRSLVPEDLEPDIREGVMTALLSRYLPMADYRLLVAPLASIQPDLLT